MSIPAAVSTTVTPWASDTPDNIRICRADSYKKLYKIGAGAFGDVCKARHRRSGKKVAIKSAHASGESSLLREAALLAACAGNPGVVEFREVVRCAETDKLCLVMEYAGDNLHCAMGKRRKDGRPFFTEAEARRVMRRLLGGVETMHQHGVVHCDLKPTNILVGKKAGRRRRRGPVLKICDLGLARSATVPSPDTSRTVEGTVGYMAPEQLMGDTVDGSSTPVDLWSLGCVMAELVSGKPLFKVDDVGACEYLVEIVRLLAIPDEVSLMPLGVSASAPSKLRDKVPEERLSLAGFDVLRGLLEFDPRDRLTAAAALQMPWFTVHDEGRRSIKSNCKGMK